VTGPFRQHPAPPWRQEVNTTREQESQRRFDERPVRREALELCEYRPYLSQRAGEQWKQRPGVYEVFELVPSGRRLVAIPFGAPAPWMV